MEFKYRCPNCGNNTSRIVDDFKEGDDAPLYFCIICPENPQCIIAKEGDTWPILPTADEPRDPESRP